MSFRLTPSGAVLIAANIFPVFGVVLWGWSTFEIVFLYWTENVIIGAINVLKMLMSPACANRTELRRASLEGQPVKTFFYMLLGKALVIPLFMIHFGGFCAAHGAALISIFHKGESVDFGSLLSQNGILYGAAILATNHFFSFFFNHLGRKEYRKISMQRLMLSPYGRIVVLHIAIIAGAFLALLFHSNIGVLIVLIMMKTGMDLRFHIAEHAMPCNVQERKRANQQLKTAN